MLTMYINGCKTNLVIYLKGLHPFKHSVFRYDRSSVWFYGCVVETGNGQRRYETVAEKVYKRIDRRPPDGEDWRNNEQPAQVRQVPKIQLHIQSSRWWWEMGPFTCYVMLSSWKIATHPPPHNANKIDPYTLVPLFSGKFDTSPHCIT